MIRGAQRLSQSSKKRVTCLTPAAGSRLRTWRGGVHVFREECAGEVAPEPATLAGFLCVLGRDPVGREGATVQPCFCTSNSVRFPLSVFFFTV